VLTYELCFVGQNVRFLANFITEAGIIIKRKQVRWMFLTFTIHNGVLLVHMMNPSFYLSLAQTGISAKAQRKIAREIKTARAFGLMPFTTMGTKAFQFGKTMENRDQDFEYEVLDDDDEFDEGNA
jgi:hypothetical protein